MDLEAISMDLEAISSGDISRRRYCLDGVTNSGPPFVVLFKGVAPPTVFCGMNGSAVTRNVECSATILK